MAAVSVPDPMEKKALRKQIEGSLRYRLLRRLFAQRPQTVRIWGRPIVIRPGTTDLKVAIESLGGEFAPAAEALPRDLTGLIVDAGGYIGTAAITLSEMFPKATVVSIEASSANFAILSRNVAAYPNIRAVQAALVATPGGPLELRNRGTGHWGFTTIAGAADRAETEVIERIPTCTLPEICTRFGFDRIRFLKLDIEGAEKALFDADPATSGMERVETLMVELHDRILPGCSDSLHAFAAGREVVQTAGEKYLLHGHRPPA